MKIVIQRVLSSKVVVNEVIVGEIEKGLLILVGIVEEDTHEDIEWLVRKIVQLRIFEDKEGIMNLSIKDINGNILIISQFTLHSLTKKGNRPSYIKAAKPTIAVSIYEEFIQKIELEMNKKLEKGIFGATMKVHLINDGPITIIIDSKNRE
jgi:D-tyrosyl-tRNA(Tyr) deacylase